MSKNSNKFSVILCVYYKDNPDYFEEALDSIINQSLKPDEIFLISFLNDSISERTLLGFNVSKSSFILIPPIL